MKKLFGILKILVALAALFFLGRAIVQNATALRGLAQSIDPWSVVVALLFSVATTFLLSVLWTAIVHPSRAFDLRFNFAYAKANLIRYIPGNIFGFGARVLFADRLGIPKVAGSLSVGIEGVFLLLTTGALSFLYLTPRLTPIAIVGVLVVAALLARNFHARQPTPTPRRAILLTILYFGYGCGLGLALFFLARSINVNVAPLEAIGLFGLAWFLGYAVLLTPSGLGVREGTIIFFLAPVLGVPAATFLAIGSRLAIIVSELLVSGLYWFLQRRASTSSGAP